MDRMLISRLGTVRVFESWTTHSPCLVFDWTQQATSHFASTDDESASVFNFFYKAFQLTICFHSTSCAREYPSPSSFGCVFNHYVHMPLLYVLWYVFVLAYYSFSGFCFVYGEPPWLLNCFSHLALAKFWCWMELRNRFLYNALTLSTLPWWSGRIARPTDVLSNLRDYISSRYQADTCPKSCPLQLVF